MENNEVIEICRKCGGCCCKQMSGAFSPEDIDLNNEEQIIMKLTTFEWSIDSYTFDDDDDDDGDDGLIDVHYLRPSLKDASKILDEAWYGECNYWDSITGCRMTFEQRPLECRAIVPTGKKCKSPKDFTREVIVLLWFPYQKQLKRLRLIAEVKLEAMRRKERRFA